MTVSRTETIGILGGSFNPIHIGHLMLAAYLTQWNYVDKIWLTLSPLNPLKDASGLLPDMKRLDMISIAIRGAKDIDVCDIELSMPRPSYTINTLDLLARRYPSKHFKLIIGSDNWRIFDKWRDYQRIIDDYGVIVYPRPGYPIDPVSVDGMYAAEAPIADISSTFIRSAISKGKDMTCFLPQGVFKYISENGLYLQSGTKLK